MAGGASFGVWVRQTRQERDLTQEALAELVGCAVDTIRKIERATRRPSRPMARRILECLAAPPDQQDALLAAARRPQKTAAPPPSNAPASGFPAVPRTPFFGRDAERALVRRLMTVEGAPLVTLAGPGGVGKTRLALELSAGLAPHFPDGVVFVDLAAIAQPDLVAPAVAQALGLREGAAAPEELVLGFVHRRRLLLVLDNFERLTGAAPWVASLVRRAPALGVLVTSRERLHLSDEQVVEVGPLGVPAGPGAVDAARARNFDAVRLFENRAGRAAPDFRLTDDNAAAVAALCVRLDGLPLAIELAAAQCRYYAPAALLERIATAGFPAAGPRDLPARHQSLDAVMAWSHATLDGPERAAFAAMSALPGGCAEDTAAAVLGPEVAPAPALSVLAALAGKSLLGIIHEPDGGPRFTILETVRQYAARRLAETGERARALRDRRDAHFTALAEAAGSHLLGWDRPRWLHRLDREVDNLRAVLGDALDGGDAATALRLAGALGGYWLVGGRLAEGRRWLERSLEPRPAPSPDLHRARALEAAAGVAGRQGDLAAVARHTAERLDLCRALGERAGLADATRVLGDLAMEAGDPATAGAHYHASLELYQQLDEPAGRSNVLNNLGELARSRGDDTGAAAYYQESLALSRAGGDQSGVARALMNLGWTELRRTGPDAAAAAFGEALAIQRRLGGSVHRIAFCLLGLGAVAVHRGDLARGVELMGAAEGLLAGVGAALDGTDRTEYLTTLTLAGLRAGPAAVAAALARGRGWTLEAALAAAAPPAPLARAGGGGS